MCAAQSPAHGATTTLDVVPLPWIPRVGWQPDAILGKAIGCGCALVRATRVRFTLNPILLP